MGGAGKRTASKYPLSAFGSFQKVFYWRKTMIKVGERVSIPSFTGKRSKLGQEGKI